MKNNKFKRLISYYKPFKAMFIADLFFAMSGASVTLAIPLIVRHITENVINAAVHWILAKNVIANRKH